MNTRLRNMTSVYLVRENEVLCLYRMGSRVANNKYIGSAGGHFEPEELNLSETDVEGLTLRYITHRLTGGEIRQNYYFFGRLKAERPLESTEGILHWIPFEDVPALEMPVSAKHMILHYLREGRFTDRIYCGITEENGTNFVAMEEF